MWPSKLLRALNICFVWISNTFQSKCQGMLGQSATRLSKDSICALFDSGRVNGRPLHTPESGFPFPKANTSQDELCDIKRHHPY